MPASFVCWGFDQSVVVGFVLCGRDVAESAVDAVVVAPADPGGDLDLRVRAGAPGTAVDQFLLERGVDGLGQDVVVGVGDRADGGRRADLSQPPGVANRAILTSPIRVMYELVTR